MGNEQSGTEDDGKRGEVSTQLVEENEVDLREGGESDAVREDKECQLGSTTLLRRLVLTAAGLAGAVLTAPPGSRPGDSCSHSVGLRREPLHDVSGVLEVRGDDGTGDLLLLELGECGDTDG